MKRFLTVILLLGALVAGSPDVSAKPLSRIIRDIGLTQADFDIMGAKAETLYATPSPKPGKVVSWTNPDSMSHGTVKLAAMRDNCAYLQHFVFPKGAEKSKEIRLQYCRNEDGKWLLHP